MKKKWMKPETVYLIYSAYSALLFIMVKNIRELYRIHVAHFTGAQLILAGTVLEISNFLFETPTGIIADHFSRKLSVIIGVAVIGISYLLEGTFPDFGLIVVFSVLFGLGSTFTSGADDAWIADEAPNEDLNHLFLKAAQAGLVFSIIGILASGILSNISLRTPYYVTGVLFLTLALFLALFMRETRFRPSKDLHSLEHMKNGIQTIFTFIKSKTVLKYMAVISLVYGLYSEGFDRLWQNHFIINTNLPQDLNLPFLSYNNDNYAGWFTLINLISLVISAIAVEYIKRRLKKTGELQKVWLLSVINMLMVLSLFGFALAKNYELAIALYFSFYIVRSVNSPIYRAWLNAHLESKSRASVLSAYGQLDSLGQIAGGLLIALIAAGSGVPEAIVFSSVILFTAVIIYHIFIKKYKKNKI